MAPCLPKKKKYMAPLPWTNIVVTSNFEIPKSALGNRNIWPHFCFFVFCCLLKFQNHPWEIGIFRYR